MTSSEIGANGINDIENSWYTVKLEDLPETKPLQSGCKNRLEVISDAFWNSRVLIECALVCARGGCHDSAKMLSQEANRWKEIGTSLVD